MPAPIPFAEWQPDKSDRQNPAAEAKGVISQAGQYAPFPDIQDYGAHALNEEFLKVLLHFNGTDASTTITDDNTGGSAHTWTAAGNAQIDTAQSVFGGASLLCDGTGDYVSTPDHADFALGASEFTIDFRFRVDAATGSVLHLAGQCDNAFTLTTVSFRIFRDASDFMNAQFVVGSTAFTVTGTTAFTDAVNPGWHHGRAIRTGNTLRLFIDGVQEGGDVSIAGSINNSTNALSVGRAGELAALEWDGWVDEFAIFVGVALTTTNFTPPTVPFGVSGSTAGIVLGSDTFYDADTAPHTFAGDGTALYHLESRTAIDRSQAGGYTVGSSDTWQFAQFGDNVVAVTRNEAPQHFDMGTNPIVAFADLAGSPPTGATSIARVNDFLMMGKDFTVHWSAFNDITDWTPDPTTQAGNQELDQERGEIISIVGLDYAAIFQERGIRRAIYVGPPVIWDFGQDYVEKARGCIARNAATPYGRFIPYAADDGFYVFDGQASQPIGDGKIDTYFTRNLNYAFRHKISCGVDYSRKLVVWACPMRGSQLPNELLIYSVRDGRWTHDEIDLEFLFDSPAEPFNVDNFNLLFPVNDLDDANITPDDIDSSTFDDRRIRLAAWQRTSHRMGLFTGAPRQAIIDTSETELAPGKRALLTEIWPLGDFQQSVVSASVGYRTALPGGTKLYTVASGMNRVGFCPARVDARFGNVRLQIAAGADWRRAEGVHVTAAPTGGR